jgi:hypothetical protein
VKFEIQTKDAEGNISFSGTMNKNEATFVLNVGINYLLANGAMPLFTGKDDDELGITAPSTQTVQ